MQNDAPAIKSALDTRRLAKIDQSPTGFAWIGLARAGGPRFDPDDGVHQGPDALRWAEWIRDARELRDYDRADSIKAIAGSLGEVRILQGGHVIVIEKIGSIPKNLIDQGIHSLIRDRQLAGGNHAPRH